MDNTSINQFNIVIPTPNLVEYDASGDKFVITGKISFNNIPELSYCYDELISTISKRLKKTVTKQVSSSFVAGQISINLNADSSIPEEGYCLEIASNAIHIEGSTERGIYYGVKTLSQLIWQFGETLPTMRIEDSPRFAYRAFMLDVGRYFYTVEQIKTFIDILAVMKLNVFHWHLTEDQGWRIEIKKYPRLTEIGSKRTHTNFNCIPHGGYYTQDEIREVVDYAHKHFIKVIPEIDMPGHMQSALASYPELGCFERKLPVATHWGVKHDILCAGKDITMRFIKDVLTEVMELFPDGYIHLGGDEAVKMRWEICPHCKAKMEELGLKTTDELQSHMINEVADFLAERGYKTIVWNEYVPTGLCNKNIIWQYYTGDEPNDNKNEMTIVKEINEGRQIINNCSNYYYLDLPYNTIPLVKTYNYDPMIKGVDDKDRILGVEAALWTEYVPNMKKALRMTCPRLLAAAEAAWTQPENKDYDAFVKKIAYHNTAIQQNFKNTRLLSAEEANPSKLKGFIEQKWFNRRIFHWAGLHNLIDDAKVKSLAKKINNRLSKY